MKDEKKDFQKKYHCTTAWKVSKCGFISGPYFPVFSRNTGKYGPQITPYLDTFDVVHFTRKAIDLFAWRNQSNMLVERNYYFPWNYYYSAFKKNRDEGCVKVLINLPPRIRAA